MARPATSLAKDTFRKRKRTIVKKAQELSKLCHARVYLVVKYHGRFHVFTSETSRQWPPTVSEIRLIRPGDKLSTRGGIPHGLRTDARYTRQGGHERELRYNDAAYSDAASLHSAYRPKPPISAEIRAKRL
ncbi:hypothetical protein LTR17_026271 [Elasticomyces elasticus]|nr:hypothetical protein LTR17_026271 [Elasticomyces elasticus]